MMKQKWLVGDEVEVQFKGVIIQAESMNERIAYKVEGFGEYGKRVVALFVREEDIVPLPRERERE